MQPRRISVQRNRYVFAREIDTTVCLPGYVHATYGFGGATQHLWLFLRGWVIIQVRLDNNMCPILALDQAKKILLTKYH